MDDNQEKKEVRARIESLRKEINHHNYLYHVQDAPEISDSEYDALMHELRDLEARFPEFISPDSPSQRVGAVPVEALGIIVHQNPLLSLADVGNDEELDAWHNRLVKLVNGEQYDFVCEHKIDGLAVSLTYINGIFETGATWGAGFRGENITQNVKTIHSVPLTLQDSRPPRLEVRGEIYLPKSGFKRVNEERLAEGLPLFANPRNAAAGSVRQLDSRITARRPLDMYVYTLGNTDDFPELNTHRQVLEQFKKWGFKVNPRNRPAETIEDIKKYYHEWEADRETLPYEADGIVAKVNQIDLQKKLGFVGREPRWAIAYKFPPVEATTRIVDIEISIGRTGTLNPVAILKPIPIGGVTITRAALHNEDDILRKDIRKNDTVIVRRAGDVIPEVVGPVTGKRSGEEKVFSLLSILPLNAEGLPSCPSCGARIFQRAPDEVAYYCTNSACPAQLEERLQHWSGRGAMDIRGIGESMSALLIRNGVRDVSDLYDRLIVYAEMLAKLERMGEKSANKLIRNIDESKNRPLERVIFALGIRHIGEEMAERLVKKFSSIDSLAAASEEDLTSIPTIGPKITESIREFFQIERNLKVIARLEDFGVQLAQEAAPEKGNLPLAGMEFVITGKLQSFSRSEAEEKIKALGGSAKSDVTRKTTYLVVGEDPGSKVARAQESGIKLIDEDELLNLLGLKKLL